MKTIIYVPGLGYDFFDISGYSYALRMMSSIDKMHSKSSLKYEAERKEIPYGITTNSELKSEVISIFECSNNSRKEIVRIYEFLYANSLTKSFSDQNIFLKLVLILFSLIRKIPTILKINPNNIFLNRNKRLEVVYLIVIYFAIVAYAFVIGMTLGTLLIKTLAEPVFNINNLELEGDAWVGFSYWFTLFTAVLAIFIPNFKILLSKIATEYLCLDYYLTSGQNKMNIVGELESLMETVCEINEPDELELHGYSFGSILIMDTIFPYGTPPITRIEKIKRIVTIGCPHDFIKSHYPNYFEEKTREGKPVEWYNIRSEIDILSSNFRRDNKSEPGSFALRDNYLNIVNLNYNLNNSKGLNFFDHFTLAGFSAHRHYWDSQANAMNCLSLLIQNEKSKLDV